MRFYVYAYLREDQTPYYIGKGKGKRAWQKNHGVNLPDESRIVMIETELSQQEAFDLEVKLIKQYGRKDLGTGILRNKTNGGEGTAGFEAARRAETHGDCVDLGEDREESESRVLARRCATRQHVCASPQSGQGSVCAASHREV